MDGTDEGQAQSALGHSVMEDMLESGLVKSTEFKSKSGQKHKPLSQDEKSKMLAMVKDLDKYKDSDENKLIPENLTATSIEDSAHIESVKPSGSLAAFVDSELACLHDVDKQQTAGKKQHKPVPHIASVSAELQMQFESLLKEDGAKLLVDAKTETAVKYKDNTLASVSQVSQVSGGKSKAEQATGGGGGMSPADKQHKMVKEKKDKKKDRQENKETSKKHGGNTSEGAVLGSYSQLLISMGRKSPNRKIEIVNDPPERVQLSPDPENPSTGKKKRNRRKKVNQQLAETVPGANLPDDRPSSAGKIKKDKSSKDNVKLLSMKQGVIADGSDCSMSDRLSSKSLDTSLDGMSRKQKKKSQQSGYEMPRNTEYPGRTQKNNEQGASRVQPAPIKDDDLFIEASVNIPKSDHMYVIGPQGRHLQDIMIETGVVVSVPKLNSKSDEIVLRGDRMQIGTAMSMMFKMCADAKMETRQNRQGQRQDQPPFQNERVMSQGQSRQAQSRQGQGQSVNDLSREMERNLTLNQNSGKSKNEMHAGQSGKSTNQQGPRQVRGQQGHQQGHGQGQGHSHGHGHGYRRQGNNNVITPRREADQNMSKGQGKRQRKKKSVFPEYITGEELTEGLKNGTIIKGPLRINPRNYEESYVPHPDGKSDILISGLKLRNRAMNGDIVAVQIHDEGEWKIHNNELVAIGNNGEESDPEVVIESEEIVEVIADPNKKSTKVTTAGNQASASNTQSPHGKVQKEAKATCQSPKHRFTTLNEMLADHSPVKKTLMTESGMDKVKKLLQRTGVVVSIIEKRSSMTCAGHIRPMPDRNPNRALFHPNDHRMPRVIIPICDCPKDFLQRPDDYANTLYVCRIEDWRPDSFFSEGCLVKRLGEKGEIEPETEGMLYENEVDFSEFTDQAVECLPTTPWSIPASEFDYRRDFRSSCVFTIDPATARDLDDALSCEDLGDGRYKVGVHIADVSYFVMEHTGLDDVASSRSTSVYLVHKVIPMLPRLLCEQLCSLNPDEDRLTFSVEWTINEQGEIEDERFGRSVIRSCVKLAYDHAQSFIEEPERDWTPDELPAISEKFTVNDIKSRVLMLHKIAVRLRKGRMEGGALRLDQVKLQYSLDPESGLPNGYTVYQQKDSNRLVEEFMLLANMAVAHKINSHFPDTSILRRHPPPQEKMVETLKEQTSALGIHLDVSTAQSLQVSLRNYSGDDENSLARMQVLVALCSKPMQNAEYFCTGCLDDENLYHHYALNVPLYTHFTSPIRRYPDILVHRLLGAALGYSDKPSRSPGELEKIAKHCNDKKTAAKRVGDLSSDLFFSIFVKTAGPLEEKAMVMGVLDKAFDIFVLKLGVSKRVYCDKLAIKEKIFKQDRKVPSLTLVWESTNEEPEFRQEITIFSMVECVLDSGDQPLQWTAVIKRPRPMTLS